MLPEPLLDPSSPDFNALLTDYIESPMPLAAIAANHALTVPQLARWRAHHRIAPILDAVSSIQRERLRVAAAIASTGALQRLDSIVCDAHSAAETARRAAAAIIALARAIDPPEGPQPPTRPANPDPEPPIAPHGAPPTLGPAGPPAPPRRFQ